MKGMTGFRFNIEIEEIHVDSTRTRDFIVDEFELKRLANLFSVVYLNRGNVTDISWTRPVEEEQEL